MSSMIYLKQSFPEKYSSLKAGECVSSAHVEVTASWITSGGAYRASKWNIFIHKLHSHSPNKLIFVSLNLKAKWIERIEARNGIKVIGASKMVKYFCYFVELEWFQAQLNLITRKRKEVMEVKQYLILSWKGWKH